ncbi:hypothetical protein KP509_03G081400 [Ceratopteris richardii]|uniref:Uncharacterized protein n=1 Tax=Ceratopteris richardii TaxID=49495 RepID=A0A8T2V5I6_CERRI|nr:hypothetical protein KP509_03G081400 [Ceratopteris richardii]
MFLMFGGNLSGPEFRDFCRRTMVPVRRRVFVAALCLCWHQRNRSEHSIRRNKARNNASLPLVKWKAYVRAFDQPQQGEEERNPYVI